MIWTPANSPPKVSVEARSTISTLITNDFDQAVARGISLVRSDYKAFGRYIVSLGNQLNALSDEGDWPLDVLKAGSALAMLAYRETGFYQAIDEGSIAIGGLLADIDGVPDAYLASLAIDPAIADLSAEIIDGQLLADDGGGLAQVFDIGAGCTRHYLQQAIAA